MFCLEWTAYIPEQLFNLECDATTVLKTAWGYNRFWCDASLCSAAFANMTGDLTCVKMYAGLHSGLHKELESMEMDPFAYQRNLDGMHGNKLHSSHIWWEFLCSSFTRAAPNDLILTYQWSKSRPSRDVDRALESSWLTTSTWEKVYSPDIWPRIFFTRVSRHHQTQKSTGFSIKATIRNLLPKPLAALLIYLRFLPELEPLGTQMASELSEGRVKRGGIKFDARRPLDKAPGNREERNSQKGEKELEDQAKPTAEYKTWGYLRWLNSQVGYIFLLL